MNSTYPVISNYLFASIILRVLLTINIAVIFLWLLYLLKLLLTQILKLIRISKSKYPQFSDYSEQYKMKVDILKYVFLMGCFICEMFSELFGFLTKQLAYDNPVDSKGLNLSDTCELLPVGWLYRFYKLPISFRTSQALWYCFTILALFLFLWLFYILNKVYRKSLNQVKYVFPIVLLSFSILSTFILSVFPQTAVFGSILYCIFVVMLYITLGIHMKRFGRVLEEIRNGSLINVENSFEKELFLKKLSQEQRTIRKYNFLVILILFLLGLDLFSQCIYNIFDVFLFSILINPCWLHHAFNLHVSFSLTYHTIYRLHESADYLILMRDLASICYIFGFICFNSGVLFLSILSSVRKRFRKRKENELEVKLLD